MLTVVCWLWGDKYTPSHARKLRAMVQRHLRLPHAFICLTDRPGALPDMETRPLPCAMGASRSRRLWIFSDAAKALGARLLQIDVDMVITGDITPLVDRAEPFVVWRSDSLGPKGYALNPSLMLFDAGGARRVWDRFSANPSSAISRARANGWKGSDQAVISDLMDDTAATWTEADGVLSYRRHFMSRTDPEVLPEGTRVVSFHGYRDPALPGFRDLPWVQEHWRC